MTPSTDDDRPNRLDDRGHRDRVGELVATFLQQHRSDPLTVDEDAARRFITTTDTTWNEWSEGLAEHGH